MPNTFLGADYHFSHRSIVEKYGRPFATIEEHDEALVENHNKVVRQNDTVIILGDVVFPKTGFQYLARLNGILTLVMGNHERHKLEMYQEHFKYIRAEKPFRDIICTHIPVHPGQYRRFGTNCHGHLHGNQIMLERMVNGDRSTMIDPRYVCVSMEHTNYTPISLEDVKVRIRKNVERARGFEEFFGFDLTIGGDSSAS